MTETRTRMTKPSPENLKSKCPSILTLRIDTMYWLFFFEKKFVPAVMILLLTTAATTTTTKSNWWWLITSKKYKYQRRSSSFHSPTPGTWTGQRPSVPHSVPHNRSPNPVAINASSAFISSMWSLRLYTYTHTHTQTTHTHTHITRLEEALVVNYT